ncbi:MAG: AMP-binding protein [Gammaproteobacteria bacterium]
MQNLKPTIKIDSDKDSPGLRDLFIEYFERYKNNYAINVDGVSYTYGELYRLASSMAQFIANQEGEICAILCSRNIYAYASILASLLANKTYLPLSHAYAEQKNIELLKIAKTRILIVDKSFSSLAEKRVSKTCKDFFILLVDFEEMPNWAKPHKAVLLLRQSSSICEIYSKKYANPNIYLLFTSGSTGKPKGVLISQHQLLYYLNNIIKIFNPCESDRFSQVIDLTFDLSAHDIFVCWASGACLYVFSGNNAIDLYRYIVENKITFWLSVPSTAILLLKSRLLKNGCFPYLRCSFFCGEPLSSNVALNWASSSNNGIVENFYGPTEATIAFTHYRFHSESGVVPIGKPFPGLKIVIMNESFQPVDPGAIGEIYLSGIQVASGYYRDKKLTRQRFVRIGSEDVWYRSGDLGTTDALGNVIFKGRKDDQLQIRGYRVETTELEMLLRRTLETEEIAITPIVSLDEVVTGYKVFVVDSALKLKDMVARCQKQMSKFLLPSIILRLDRLPKMVNGKIDYAKLKKIFI